MIASAVPSLNDVSLINSIMSSEPNALISAASDYYFSQIETAADTIAQRFSGNRIVLLGGASGSGKTTTAGYIAESLRRYGLFGHIISLDNFYFGLEIAPKLPDGSYDYEAVEALDLDELHRCVHDMLVKGSALLPVFDFLKGKPSDKTNKIDIGEKDVIIFEGIHALNPAVANAVNEGNALSIYVSVEKGFCDKDREILSSRDIRLIRRLVRDLKFRNSSFENTLQMWRQVVVSERKNILPFRDKSDIVIDTFHCFEPCIMKLFLQEGAEHGVQQAKVEELLYTVGKFVSCSSDSLSENSLLHEFIG